MNLARLVNPYGCQRRRNTRPGPDSGHIGAVPSSTRASKAHPGQRAMLRRSLATFDVQAGAAGAVKPSRHPAKARLDRWLRATGLRPAGPTRLRYLQFGAASTLRLPAAYLVDAAQDYLTEIQVPVSSGEPGG